MQRGYTVRRIGLDSWGALLPSSEAHASSHELGKQQDEREASRGPECRANAEDGDRSSGKPHFWRSELRCSCLFSGRLATEPHPSYFLFPTRSNILLVGMYKLCSETPGVCRNPLVGISPPLPLKVTRPRGVNVMSTPECKSGERKLNDGELTCFVQNKVWPRQEDSSPEGEACSVQ